MTDHCDVPKFFFGFERSFCRCVAVMSCDLGVMCLWFDFLSSSDVASCHLICTTPVLLCTTKTYNVLLQYYSNVLLRSTTYYSRTTLYYKVLLFTEKYYASTTLHYTILLQYYFVLQSTTAVWLELLHVMWCHVWAFQEVALVTKLPSSRG